VCYFQLIFISIPHIHTYILRNLIMIFKEMTFGILEAILKHCSKFKKYKIKNLLIYCKCPVSPILFLILDIGNNVNEVTGCHVIY